MPWSPPRPCIDCRKLQTNGARCVEHTRSRERQRSRDRGKTAERGLGAAWQRKSREAREQTPYCQQCYSTEDLTLDHARPRALGGTAEDAGMVLCRRCNSAKGAR